MTTTKIYNWLVAGFLLALPVSAQVMKEPGPLDLISFADRTLGARTLPRDLSDVPEFQPTWADFFNRYGRGYSVWIDLHTGLPASVNGPGLAWGESVDLGLDLEASARRFVAANAGVFRGLSSRLLSLNADRSASLGAVTYLDFDVVYAGVPIEGARVVFRLNQGNMVQFGAEGVLPEGLEALDPSPVLTAKEAQDIAFVYAGGFNPKTDTLIEGGRLIFVPRLGDPDVVSSDAVGYRLVWEVRFTRVGELGTWLAHVDAHTGRLLQFYDANDYAVVKGGVYPESPTTTAETTLPMPYADVRNTSGTVQEYANSAGRFSYASTAKSYLSGSYVSISDNCGSISHQAAAGSDIDFGTSTGTDCTTPGIGGSGNTHAARSAFYHVNRIKEKGRAWLPSNSWLQGSLTANMNINDTCNANWNGSTINFFKSGGGCGNTGEIAAIFLHEYGHGLDSNDGKSPADKGTGEAYGDTTAFLQTHDSCIGPGFLGSNCDGYGDNCTSCTGVRDVDYGKHSSAAAHTVAAFVKNTCPSSSSYQGPCGKEGHCESMVLSESLWDLAARRLPAQGYDAATSWYILDRLFYLTRPTASAGYSCSNYVASGCGASNWHQAFLAADDDDGNLSNGTPHALAIYQAFSTHGVHCTSATQTNSSTCSGSLTSATPSLSASGASNSVSLSWGAITGASSYDVLRNDFGCDAGFTKAGSTSSTSFTDTAVANGFTYYYRIVAVASGGACFSRLSNCKTVTPSGGGSPTYSITGTITESGAPLSGVTVAYSGTASGSVLSQSNGTYAISGLGDGGYTLTPSKSGYTFSPASQSVTVSGANVTGVDFAATAQSTDTQLASGVPVNGSVGYHEWKYFYISVPSGATQLSFATTNATADVDLYTRLGAKPTLTTYDCRPYSSSGNETCNHANPAAGTWWAGVYGYAAGSFTITGTVTAPSGSYTVSGTITQSGGGALSGVTVTLSGAASGSTTSSSTGAYSFAGLANGSYTLTPSLSGYTFSPTSRSVTVNGADVTGQNFVGTGQQGGDVGLTNGVPYNDSMSASTRQGSWKYYFFDITTGDSALTVTLNNLSHDLDLYVKLGAKPTLSSYDCRPYTGGTTAETCTFASPGVGRFWVGVNNWDVASGMTYTVTASWTEGGGSCANLSASYNGTYGCPACTTVGTSCNAPESLLVNAGNDEPNYPNTADACTDGSSGAPQSDESIDSVKVSATDGVSCLAPGVSAKVDFSAYIWGAADYVAIYYSTSATSPSWTLIASGSGYTAGKKNLSTTLTLGGTAGSTQAVRAQIRYNSATNNPCSGGSYDDHDDLVFKLQ